MEQLLISAVYILLSICCYAIFSVIARQICYTPDELKVWSGEPLPRELRVAIIILALAAPLLFMMSLHSILRALA